MLLFFSLAAARINAQEATPTSAGHDAALLTLSASTGVDDNGRAEGAVDVRDPLFQGVQVYSTLAASLTINPQHERFHWQANASTGVRYYEGLQETLPAPQVLGGSLSFPLGSRTTVSLNGTGSYSPTYALAPFLPGVANTVGSFSTPDYGVVRSPNYSTAANFLISQALTARATISAGYGMTAVRFTDAGEPDLTGSNAEARFTYRVTKYGSVHAGYRQRLGQYDFSSSVQQAKVEDYDLGVDYSRPLRASRSTTLNFTTGSSIYRDFDGHHYAATGSATLDHRIGRTGRVSVIYSRGVGFLEGLLAPIFTDTVTASASTALSRRVRLASSGGYVFGNVGISDAENRYGAWTGSGQLLVSLSRRTSLQAGYTFYQHDVGDAVQLLSHLPNQQRQQSVYLGLSYAMPMIRERVRTDPIRAGR